MEKRKTLSTFWQGVRHVHMGTTLLAPLALGAAASVACSDAADSDDLTENASNAVQTSKAVADSWVRSGSSVNSNKGSDANLYGDANDSGGAERRILIKFAVTGSSGKVIRAAKVRLHCTSGSVSGGSLRSVNDSSWEELKVTWNNQPAVGAVLATRGAVVGGEVVEFDVTSAVRSDGMYSFAITTSSDDEVKYASRETAGAAPELSLTYDETSGDAGVSADANPLPDSGTPDATPDSAPPPPAPSSGDYLIMSRSALKALPTSGSAWSTVKSSADASVSPDLCDQNNKADVNALAAGLVYARTGDVSYRNKVISLITRAMPTQKDGCYNAVLALGRQLGGYVMAADLADYRDASFTSWLSQLRTREIGGHSRWSQLRFTADDSANNWGVFAATSSLAADRFLGDSAKVAHDWAIFKGYTDGSWPFKQSSSYQAAWNCGSYVPIEYRNCKTPGGLDQNGAPAEDASRDVYPAPHPTYTSEAMQGFVVQALLLRQAGYDSFGIGNSAIARVAAFQSRFGIANASSPGYYTMRVVNRVYGTSYPEMTPMSGGRVFGFADWLFP